jgi:hypothetical protein
MTAAHSQTMPENDPVPPQPETTHPPETAPEEHQFAGIVDVARWATATAFG